MDLWHRRSHHLQAQNKQSASRNCKQFHMLKITLVRYLGIYIVSSRIFKCSLHYAKCGFYRAANAIFGKVSRVASEETILQLN